MTQDMYLVVGLAVLVLAVPAIFSALRNGVAPRVPALLLLIGGGLVVIAVSGKPGGYRLEDIPTVIEHVITRAFR